MLYLISLNHNLIFSLGPHHETPNAVNLVINKWVSEQEQNKNIVHGSNQHAIIPSVVSLEQETVYEPTVEVAVKLKRIV